MRRLRHLASGLVGATYGLERVQREYRLVLGTGLGFGSYLREFERAGNTRLASLVEAR